MTVLADEILDVTYELRLYPPLTDVVQTVSITGSASHEVTTRASGVTGYSSWHAFLGNSVNFDPNSGTVFVVYNGEPGAITGQPAGSSGSSGNAYTIAYGNNNLYRDGAANFSLSQGNVAGGIRTVFWATTHGCFQTRFAPVIDKTAVKTLNLVFRVAWARNV